MSETDSNRLELCARCGASLPGELAACLACGFAPAEAVPLTATPIDPNPYAVSSSAAGSVAPTFRLSTLLLTMTLISVCLGVATWSPGIGVALALLATPAYVRTALAGLRLRREGKPPTIEEKVFVFFASLAIVTSTIVATGVAFYGTCWVGFLGGAFVSETVGVKGLDVLFPGLLVGVVLGCVAGLVALIFAIRWLWPYRKF